MTATGASREQRAAAYEGERPSVQALVPPSARRILDLGCSSGALGAALKRRQPAEIVGVALNAGYVASARERLDHVIHADLDDGLEQLSLDGGAEPFDCLIAADVLEHLVDPWSVLRSAAALLAPGGVAIVNVPNVRHWSTFVHLGLHGRWPRDASGIFDGTHLRWFALDDSVQLVASAGLSVDRVDPQHGVDGWRRAAVCVVRRTPLGAFLVTQYIVRGTR